MAAAGKPERVEAFVRPVSNDGAAVWEHNPNVIETYGGDYSTLPRKAGGHGPNATNGDGGGSPAGPHSSPGDTDCSAVWNDENPE